MPWGSATLWYVFALGLYCSIAEAKSSVTRTDPAGPAATPDMSSKACGGGALPTDVAGVLSSGPVGTVETVHVLLPGSNDTRRWLIPMTTTPDGKTVIVLEQGEPE